MAKTMPTRIKNVEITIVEGERERTEKIKIVKAALGKWKKLIDSVKKLFAILPEVLERKGVKDTSAFIDEIELSDVILLIPDMLEAATDEVISFLSLGTGLEVEYLEEKVGLDELVDLLEAIIEVNNLIKVVQKGKNLMNLWGGKKVRQRK